MRLTLLLPLLVARLYADVSVVNDNCTMVAVVEATPLHPINFKFWTTTPVKDEGKVTIAALNTLAAPYGYPGNLGTSTCNYTKGEMFGLHQLYEVTACGIAPPPAEVPANLYVSEIEGVAVPASPFACASRIRVNVPSTAKEVPELTFTIRANFTDSQMIRPDGYLDTFAFAAQIAKGLRTAADAAISSTLVAKQFGNPPLEVLHAAEGIQVTDFVFTTEPPKLSTGVSLTEALKTMDSAATTWKLLQSWDPTSTETYTIFAAAMASVLHATVTPTPTHKPAMSKENPISRFGTVFLVNDELVGKSPWALKFYEIDAKTKKVTVTNAAMAELFIEAHTTALRKFAAPADNLAMGGCVWKLSVSDESDLPLNKAVMMEAPGFPKVRFLSVNRLFAPEVVHIVASALCSPQPPPPHKGPSKTVVPHTPTPVKPPVKPPVKQHTPTPVKPAPVKPPVAPPVKQHTPTPVKQPVPAPVKHTPTPVKELLASRRSADVSAETPVIDFSRTLTVKVQLLPRANKTIVDGVARIAVQLVGGFKDDIGNRIYIYGPDVVDSEESSSSSSSSTTSLIVSTAVCGSLLIIAILTIIVVVIVQKSRSPKPSYDLHAASLGRKSYV